MKKALYYLIPVCLLFAFKGTYGQAVYVDPAVAAATASHAGIINNQLDRTNSNLTLIQKGQLALTGQMTIVNEIQSKLLKGLTEVASALRNVLAIKEIAEITLDITGDIQKSLSIASSNPPLLLFAEAGASEFYQRAISLSAEVSSFILRGSSDNLMDSGERAKLLNNVRTELMILRGVSYGMYRSMFWAKQRGLLNALNPYTGFINIDEQIANDIIFNSKLIKK